MRRHVYRAWLAGQTVEHAAWRYALARGLVRQWYAEFDRAAKKSQEKASTD